MSKTFHKLNADGLQKFRDYFSNNKDNTEKYIPLPTYLIQNPTYCEDSKIEFDISHLQGMDLWEIGKELLTILDNNQDFQNLDFDILWSSLSLYFSDVILPEKYHGRTKSILEWRRYIPDTGRNRHKHLLYSSYLCYKIFGENSKFIILKNDTHTAFADRFLSRPNSYRYPVIFDAIKSLSPELKISYKLIENIMMYVGMIAVNHSLLSMDTNDILNNIPEQLKTKIKND